MLLNKLISTNFLLRFRLHFNFFTSFVMDSANEMSNQLNPTDKQTVAMVPRNSPNNATNKNMEAIKKPHGVLQLNGVLRIEGVRKMRERKTINYIFTFHTYQIGTEMKYDSSFISKMK